MAGDAGYSPHIKALAPEHGMFACRRRQVPDKLVHPSQMVFWGEECPPKFMSTCWKWGLCRYHQDDKMSSHWIEVGPNLMRFRHREATGMYSLVAWEGVIPSGLVVSGSEGVIVPGSSPGSGSVGDPCCPLACRHITPSLPPCHMDFSLCVCVFPPVRALVI